VPAWSSLNYDELVPGGVTAVDASPNGGPGDAPRHVGGGKTGVRHARIAARAAADAMPSAARACASAAHRWCAIIPMNVIHRQEVRPVNAVSIVGALLRSTIPRLR
jgi:hypothetical protein